MANPINLSQFTITFKDDSKVIINAIDFATATDYALKQKQLTSPNAVIKIAGMDKEDILSIIPDGTYSEPTVNPVTSLDYSTAVTPADAGTAGCLVFPASGHADVGAIISMIAVAKGNYHFVKWQRNSADIGTDEILNTTLTALASGEASAVYTAVFEANS